MNRFTLKKLLFWGRCILSVSILIYLFSILCRSNLYTVISKTNLAYLWIAPVMILIGLYFAAIRWHILLSSLSIHQSISQSFRFYLVAGFYSIILPGMVGTDAVRISLSSLNQKRPFWEITMSVLIERFLGFIVLLILGSLAAQIIPQVLAVKLGSSILQVLNTTTLAFLVILLITYVLIRLLPENGLIEINSNKFFRFLLKLLRIIKKIPVMKLFVVALCAAVSQSTAIIASFFLAKSIGIYLPLSTFFVVLPIVAVVAVLPISLGGLGVREGVLTYLLSRVEVLPADAVIYSLLIYLNQLFVSASVGGAIQLFEKPVCNEKP